MSTNTHGGAFIQRNRAQLLEGAASATVKALLRNDSIVVRATGYEAAYDPEHRTVHVPAFSMRQDDDPRLLNTFRGTLDQTCARVAFTDYDALKAAEASWGELGVDRDAQARLKALTEVFETARIEKSWAIRNPGSRKFMADMHAYWGEKTGGAAATNPETTHPTTREPIGVFGALLQGIARIADGTLKLADMHPVTAQLMQMVADEIVAGLAATSTTEAATAAGAIMRKLREPPPPPSEPEKGDEQDEQDQEEEQEEQDAPEPDSDDEPEDEDEPEGDDSGDNQEKDEDSEPEEGDEGESADSEPDNDDQDEEDGDGSSEGGDSDENEGNEGEDGEKDGDGPGDCEDSGSESDQSEKPGEGGPGDDNDEPDTDDDTDADGEGEGSPGEESTDDADTDGEGDPADSESGDEGEDSEEDGDGGEGEQDSEPEEGDEGEEEAGEGESDGENDGEPEEGDEPGDNQPGKSAPSGPPSLGQDSGNDAGLSWGSGLPDDDGEPAETVSFEPQDGPLGAGPPGAGVGMAVAAESAAEALGGDWGELPTAGELVASEVLADPDRRPYTIHPDARALDAWERFDAEQREAGKKVVKGLRGAGSSAVAYLSNHLRDVLAATKQTLYVGGLDDGEDLDEEALPGVALGLPSSSIYADTFTRHDDNAFVMVLVDCSGSMGTSSPTRFCARHGAISADLDHWAVCQKRDGTTRCGQPLKYKVSSAAGYAAVTALALHESLRLSNVPHAVLGFTTSYGATSGDNPTTPAGHPMWSRMRCSNLMKVFVEAPGLSDDGSALPYITGSGANLDGEALKEAAIYAAQNAGEADRIVVIVVSDGLPSAADDRPMNKVHLKRTVEEVANAGIEVYGVGIGINPQVYAQFFPEIPAVGRRAATGYVTLENGAVGLSVAVLGRLVRILGKSVGYSRGA